MTTPGVKAWADSLTAEQVKACIPGAIADHDWLAVEGLLKLLAVKDPQAAQAIYDLMLIAVAPDEEPAP